MAQPPRVRGLSDGLLNFVPFNLKLIQADGCTFFDDCSTFLDARITDVITSQRRMSSDHRMQRCFATRYNDLTGRSRQLTVGQSWVAIREPIGLLAMTACLNSASEFVMASVDQ